MVLNGLLTRIKPVKTPRLPVRQALTHPNAQLSVNTDIYINRVVIIAVLSDLVFTTVLHATLIIHACNPRSL